MKAPNPALRDSRSAILLLLAPLAILLAACTGQTSGTNPPPPVIVAVTPNTVSVQTGQTQQFTATVTGTTNTAVTWSLSSSSASAASLGTISATGLYTAPATVPTGGSVTVKAISQADNAKSDTATVTITTAPVISITLSPTSSNVQAGIGKQNFTATVTNDSQNKGVTWSLSGTGCTGTGCGTLTNVTATSVTYNAPASVPSPATVTLKATSVADTTRSASATITIAPAIAVSVAPTSANVTVSLTQGFTATVTNDAQNKGVSWTLSGAGCSGATCGTLTGATTTSVTYNAPATVPSPATATLTATSIADSSKTSAATITVMSPGSTTVAISPKRGALTLGQTLTFSATVNGAASTAVTWEVDGTAGGSASVGTISLGGVYTAPNGGGVHNIVARSTVDTTATSPASPIGVTDLAGVYTYHNDNSRTGANTQEYALTTANVNTATFGKLFSCSVDAAIYAQPLWVANVSISGVNHNVIYVATQHDSVYAFDADSNASSCVPLWTASLIDAAHGGATGETWTTSTDASCDDLVPDIGIVGTPVIDATTNTLYVVSKTKNTAVKPFHQRLHAIDMTTGSEKVSPPMEISASVPGTGAGSTGGMVSFDALINNERPALLLTGSGATGHVIVSWASHCDAGPYHGWVMSYSGGTLAQEAVLNVSPNGIDSGIWMSGSGPAADAAGNIYLATGNGTFDANAATAPNNDYGDAVMKLGPPSGGTFPVLSYFRPFTIVSPNTADTDQGSGGVLLLPPLSGNNHLLQAGKDGNMYVLDQSALGGFNASSNQVAQEIAGGLTQGLWGSPTYWNGFATFGPAFGAAFTQYSVSAAGILSSTSQSRATGFNFPGPTASVSAQGATGGTGIVWALDNQAYCTAASSSCGPTILHAYDATNLAIELWTSSGVAADKAGNAVKFTVPTVANGKVYVGTRGNNTGGAASSTSTPGEIDVYGLKPN